MLIAKRLIVFSVLVCGALCMSAFVFMYVVSAAGCTMIDSTKNTPPNSGTAYNLFSSAKELLLNAECGTNNFSVVVGSAAANEKNLYVYEKGYRWNGSSWESFSYTPKTGSTKSGQFIKGFAEKSGIAYANDDYTFFAAYTCLYDAGAWKCGCRDKACTTSYWQLQAVPKPAQVNGGIPLAITKDGSGSGTVTSNIGGISCGNTCAANFQGQGNTVTLTATAASGSVFAGWGGACAYRENASTCTVTMDTFKQVTATFQPAGIVGGITPLPVSKTGTGSGTVTSTPSGISCGSTCTGLFPSGTGQVTLTATPASGSVFAGWSTKDLYGNNISICGTALSCKVSLNGITVTATFNTAPKENYTLSVSKSGTAASSGIIRSDDVIVQTNSVPPTTFYGIECGGDCSQTYNAGKVVTLTAVTVHSGIMFQGWDGACASGTDANICKVTMNAAKSVMAVFNTTGGI